MKFHLGEIFGKSLDCGSYGVEVLEK